jgi:uncharacterized membrane protein HdeD (DUF308 family)
MANLILILLGVGYLQQRARLIVAAGWVFLVCGIAIFVDAMDNALYFPINFFAVLFLIDGIATLVVAQSGVGGQRVLRYTKGSFTLLAGILILAGHHHGHFLLAMIFGLLFLVGGLLQCIASYVVRYDRWRYVFAAGLAEVALAIFFFQPYPTHYVGTVPACLGLLLTFSGLRLFALGRRVRHLEGNPGLVVNKHTGFMPSTDEAPKAKLFDGPPAATERALTVHIWTPTGSAKGDTRNYPLIDRYIAAVDVNGVVSTGHAALESPEGIYISLYPAEEIDHSPEEFGTLLRATADNDVPGVFQPDYPTESKAWCPSTVQVRIRNYDAARLAEFWAEYRKTTVYNLTHRNCSSSVSAALEAALDGVVGRLHGPAAGWSVMLRLLLTPELWVASQIRKRALTMAWTPGLTLDYARALSMLADPRPFAWWSMAQRAIRQISLLRANWRRQDRAAAERGSS